VRLEEAELADSLCGDAGGGEVGDGTGGKLDAGVGDIGIGAEDGEAGGPDFVDGGLGELEHDVQVMDHEVEDDIDVKGAWGKEAEAVSLKEHGVMRKGAKGLHSGIETFQVAYLKGEGALLGEGDQVVSLGEVGSDGFLDEEVQAGLEESS
jgi:hypothetical protein